MSDDAVRSGAGRFAEWANTGCEVNRAGLKKKYGEIREKGVTRQVSDLEAVRNLKRELAVPENRQNLTYQGLENLKKITDELSQSVTTKKSHGLGEQIIRKVKKDDYQKLLKEVRADIKQLEYEKIINLVNEGKIAESMILIGQIRQGLDRDQKGQFTQELIESGVVDKLSSYYEGASTEFRLNGATEYYEFKDVLIRRGYLPSQPVTKELNPTLFGQVCKELKNLEQYKEKINTIQGYFDAGQKGKAFEELCTIVWTMSDHDLIRGGTEKTAYLHSQIRQFDQLKKE